MAINNKDRICNNNKCNNSNSKICKINSNSRVNKE